MYHKGLRVKAKGGPTIEKRTMTPRRTTNASARPREYLTPEEIRHLLKVARSRPACDYPHLSTPNQRLAGFVQIVTLCAELFEGPPRQATLSGSNIDRSRNYNGPCGWSEMWVIARARRRVRKPSGYRWRSRLKRW